jgi:hypothetical protein
MGLPVDFLPLKKNQNHKLSLIVDFIELVITALGSREAFINMIYETVDPRIRALRGEPITTSLYAMALPLLSRLN